MKISRDISINEFPSVTDKKARARDHSKNICHTASHSLHPIFYKYSGDLEFLHSVKSDLSPHYLSLVRHMLSRARAYLISKNHVPELFCRIFPSITTKIFRPTPRDL